MCQQITICHFKIFVGHAKIVGLLLEKKADFDISDSNGETGLHYAAQNNYAVSIAGNVCSVLTVSMPELTLLSRLL